MSWSVELTARARKDLKRLGRQDAGRVVEALERLAESGHGDVQRLTDTNPPEWRLRVREWRVRFRYDTAARQLVVLRVLPRGEAYR